MSNEPSKYDLVQAEAPADFKKAKELFIEYAGSLNIDLCFQEFEKELKEIRLQYRKPSGGLILIRETQTGEYIGCVGIRQFETDIAELKRMYIKENHRNKGLGKQLLEMAISIARDLKYTKIRLDTLEFMGPAIKLYRDNGFRETGSYRYNPRTDVIYFERELI